MRVPHGPRASGEARKYVRMEGYMKRALFQNTIITNIVWASELKRIRKFHNFRLTDKSV